MLYWHNGRCLSYGDGVAYSALAELVRQRLGIAEDDSGEQSERRLVEGLSTPVHPGCAAAIAVPGADLYSP